MQLPGLTMVRRLPKGGMTDISLALDAEGRPLIVRCIKPIYARDRHLGKAFAHGARVLASLHHPSIVRLLGQGEADGVPYQLVEYHEGRNLRERISQKWPGLREYPFQIMHQLASALHHVHASGFLHMDLKPENMLVRDDAHAVLLDFDLAVEHRGKPLKVKELEGSPSYFAPETLLHHTMDECAEVFVFGICMYEMLTGHKPFESNTPQGYRQAVADARRPAHPMREYTTGVPGGLESIILKCLAKTPDTRYPCMALVLRDLNQLV